MSLIEVVITAFIRPAQHTPILAFVSGELRRPLVTPGDSVDVRVNYACTTMI